MKLLTGPEEWMTLVAMLSSPLFRRLFAALAALAVLVAPGVQLVHAQAMAHELASSDCAQAASSHDHHGHGPAGHHAQHQHAGTCCDFCGTGCVAVALPAAGAVTVSPFASTVSIARMSAVRSVALRASHILPFSHAPPRSSV